MELRKPDDSFINILVGNDASRKLSELEVQLVLVHSACLMALEGTSRASASEVCARALKEYRIEATASFAGQSFSTMGITSVTTHGKNRLVLDADKLEEIRQDIESKCRQAIEKLEASITKFKELPQRIKELDLKWKYVLSQRRQEQELVRLINEDRRNPSRLEQYQAEYQKVQKRNEYIESVKKEIKALERQEKKLPDLEDRKTAIQARITNIEKAIEAVSVKERDIALREQQTEQKLNALARRLDKLQKRYSWIELAELDQAIEASKKELDSLSRQLGEKRTLLDKMLGRNKGAVQ